MITPDKDQIKKVFASKLKGIEQDPPAFMWERIESGLVDQSLKPKTRNLRYKIAGWATVAVAAAVMFGLFLFLPPKENVGSNQIAVLETVSEPKDTNTVPAIEEPIKKPAVVETPYHNKKSAQVLLAQTNENIKKESELVGNRVQVNKNAETVEKTNITSNSQPANMQMLATSALPAKKEVQKADETEVSKADLQKQIEAFEAEGHKGEKLLADNMDAKSETPSDNKGLDLGINGGGAFSKADGYKRTVMAMANADQQLSLRSETVKLEHNQPITFGLSVNKRINDKLSIESGITYTYLSSKIKSKSASAYSQNNSQYFHYLGIPLTINYNVAEWNKVRLYLSAGGAIQKDIYGRLDKNGSVSQSQSSNNKSISQKNAQMSLTSSIGISYPIYGNMSLYTTVGGAYYIDAKNDYETIFSDKKWLLNLNLGIKFGF